MKLQANVFLLVIAAVVISNHAVVAAGEKNLRQLWFSTTSEGDDDTVGLDAIGNIDIADGGADGAGDDVAVRQADFQPSLGKLSVKSCKSGKDPVTVSCGGTIDGKVKLAENVECKKSSGNIAFVVDGGELDCQGKAIIAAPGGGAPNTGVKILNGGKVKNCIIANFKKLGIRMEGSGNRLEKTVVTDNGSVETESNNGGLLIVPATVTSSRGNNFISDVTFSNNIGVGIVRIADGVSFTNIFEKVSILNSKGAEGGVFIQGGGNVKFKYLDVIGNNPDGITGAASGFQVKKDKVNGAEIKVEKARFMHNKGDGFYVGGENNDIECKKCITLGNGGSGVNSDSGKSAGLQLKITSTSSHLNFLDGIEVQSVGRKELNGISSSSNGRNGILWTNGAGFLKNVLSQYNQKDFDSNLPGDNYGLDIDNGGSGATVSIDKGIKVCNNVNGDIAITNSPTVTVNDDPICSDTATFTDCSGTCSADGEAATEKCA